MVILYYFLHLYNYLLLQSRESCELWIPSFEPYPCSSVVKFFLNCKMHTRVEDIHAPGESDGCTRPLFLASVPAGFPSPADDYIERKLDLNTYLVRHPAATFFVRVTGDSMVGAGIHSGDMLIVDRSLEPSANSVVIARVEGELTVKRIRKRAKKLFLVPDNCRYESVEVRKEMDFEIWGVVTSVIHHL